MKKILLQYFAVKLDENGKELQWINCFDEANAGELYKAMQNNRKFEEAKTVIKPPTLSDFIIAIWDYESELFKRLVKEYTILINQSKKDGIIESGLIDEGSFILSGLNSSETKTINQALTEGWIIYINPDKI